MLLELEAKLRCVARRFDEATGEGAARNRATPGELGHVEKMAAFVAQNPERQLSLAQIARGADLNANYAATLFRREFGTTRGEFLLRTQLAHA